MYLLTYDNIRDNNIITTESAPLIRLKTDIKTKVDLFMYTCFKAKLFTFFKEFIQIRTLLAGHMVGLDNARSF